MSQIAVRTESFGAGDQSWLGSREGTDTPKSISLDPAAWTAKTTADGRILSGEAYAEVAGLAVPFNSGGAGGTNVLAGFVLTDLAVRAGGGNVTGAGIWRGRILTSKLPSPVAAGVTGLFRLEA